jgi:hypothetical protein
MSVASVIITNQGDRGRLTGDASTVSREYSITLKASCTSKLDTTATVAEYLRTHTTFPSGPGRLPYLGRSYGIGNTRDSSVYCENLSIDRIGKSDGPSGTPGGVDFLIVAGFKPVSGGGLPPVKRIDINGKPQENPLLWKDDISTRNYTITIPAETGRFWGAFDGKGNIVNCATIPLGGGTAVMNSATDIFDPPPSREVSITVLRITRSILAVFPHQYEKYIGAVNVDNVVINKGPYGFLYRFEPTQGLIKTIDNEFDIANGIPYWRHTIEVHVNPLGWRRQIPDIGPNQLGRAEVVLDGVTISNSDVGPSGFFKKRFVDVRGNPVIGLLNGNGVGLKAGQEPVYLSYQIENEIPFAGINW